MRWAAHLLKEAGCFPETDDRCLEVGCGELGWLPDLLGWGVQERNLHGLDLSLGRLSVLRRALPAIRAVAANGGLLPYRSSAFGLVVASTVFSSILDDGVRVAMAEEMKRCVRPGGALLVYDFVVGDPRNPNVRGFGAREAKRLFSPLAGAIRHVTLVPPLARAVASQSWFVTALLESVPFLRSHVLGVFRKPSR